MDALSKRARWALRHPGFWIFLLFWIAYSAFLWWAVGSVWAGVGAFAYALVAGAIENWLYKRRAGDKEYFSAFSEGSAKDPWKAD